MSQLSLRIRSYRGILSIIDNSDLDKRALKFIFVSFGILALFYVVILGSITFNIVERRSMETSARGLANEVQELELTYLEMSEKVDATLAEKLGFEEKEASFATRKSLGSIKFASNGF